MLKTPAQKPKIQMAAMPIQQQQSPIPPIPRLRLRIPLEDLKPFKAKVLICPTGLSTGEEAFMLLFIYFSYSALLDIPFALKDKSRWQRRSISTYRCYYCDPTSIAILARPSYHSTLHLSNRYYSLRFV